MKRILGTLGICIALALSAAAQKSDVIAEQEFETAAQLSDLQTRRAFVAELPADVRAAVWQKHFDHILALNEWNLEQRLFIQRVAQMSPEIFSQKSGSITVFLLEMEAKRLFKPGEFVIFGEIVYLGKGSVECEMQAISCGCSVGSSFNWSCNSGATCSSGYCNRRPGCGFLGFYECNGNCVLN